MAAADDVFEFGEIKAAAEAAVADIVAAVLDGRRYDSDRARDWIAQINDRAVAALVALSSNFKFAVHTTIVQNKGAGVSLANACVWEEAADGVAVVNWGNRDLVAAVTVFAAAL